MTIVTIASHRPTQSYYLYDAFFASCERYEVHPIVLKDGYGGLGTKPVLLRHAIEDGLSGQIIFTDCFDVVFQSDPREIFRIAPKDKIIWNAEMSLFPDNPKLRDQFPEPKTRFRFLNSGFAVGSTELFLKAINELPQDMLRADRQNPDGSWDTPNDQELWQKEYLFGTVPMALDTHAEICQTLSGVVPDDLDFSYGAIRNKETGSVPFAFHCNGRKEDWKPILCQHLQLPQ